MYVRLYDADTLKEKWLETDQILHSVASDLSLHYLPVICLVVSNLQGITVFDLIAALCA